MTTDNKRIPSVEELSAAMEKMYHEHNMQVASLSRMITALARLAGYEAKQFAEEVRNDKVNFDFADVFNKNVDLK